MLLAGYTTPNQAGISACKTGDNKEAETHLEQII